MDRQRIAAVRLLEDLGYRWSDRDRAWTAREHRVRPVRASSQPLTRCMTRSRGRSRISPVVPTAPRRGDLERLVDLAQAYEAARPRD